MPSIDVLMNAREVQRGAKDVAKALDEVADAADDVSREGAQGADKFERGLRDIVQAARPAEKAVKDVGDAADKAGDDAKRGMKKASEGTAEFKDEAKQSAREGAASFTGEFDDVADYIQEVLANALGGFGPAGAAAGIALAAILGTILSQTQAAQDKLVETREGAVDLASTMYEEGGVLPLTERVNELLTLLGRERAPQGFIENIVNGFVDLGTNIDAARRAASTANVPIERMITALSGTQLQESKRILADITEQLEAARDIKFGENVDIGAVKNVEALQSMQTELQAVITKSELADDLYSSTEFMNAQRIDDLASAWGNAGVQASNYFKTGEDGVKTFDVGKYIADWEAQVAQADEVKKDLLELPESIKAEAERQWAAGGVGAADAYVDAYQAADGATRAKLEAIAGPQGQAAGRKAAQGFVEAAESRFAGYTLPELNAKLRIDDSDLRRYTPRTVIVQTQLRTPSGRIATVE